MELKHFSHNHGLVFHQLPQGSQIQCSACKSSGSGNVYVCWQCNYFLHEQCFHAARSVKHPAHPLHPLTLVPFPTYPSGSFVCNSCNHGGDGFSYTCCACEFDIHLQCALIMPSPNYPHPAPNYNSQPQNPIYPPANQNYPPPPPQPQFTTSYAPLIPNSPFPNVNPAAAYTPNQPPLGYPQQEPAATIIKHFSHPHALKAVEEIEEKSGKACTACKWEISAGSAYSCKEPHCSFILDKGCFDAPREVRHKSHPQHPLTLLKASPADAPFDCYACWRSGKGFAYACLTCSFTIHIDCASWAETVAPGVSHKHPLTLYYSAAEASGQDASFTCTACKEPINQKAWRYYCRECGIGCHTRCPVQLPNATAAAGKTEAVKDQVVSMQELQMQMEMTRIHAQMIASIGTSVCNLI